MSALGRRALGTMFVVGAILAIGHVVLPVPAAAQSPPSAPIASAPPPAGPEVERLRERTAAHWAARVAGDSKAQWELLEPRGRARLTPAEYGASAGGVKYIAYQVEDATIEGYFASVKVRMIVQPVLPTAQAKRIGPTTVVLMDRWVRIRGTWYRSLEQESSEPSSR
jgi:hypothetical protein